MKNLKIIRYLLLILSFQVSIASYCQTETMAELKDVSIQYWDFGGKGNPLIFIHGDSRAGSQFNYFAKEFSATNHIVTYARRGYGKSKAHNQEKGIDADANDLMKLMEFLDIEKAVFIGNSYAGFLMTYLAENHKDKIIAQIYLAGNPGYMFNKIIENDTIGAYKMMFWAQGGEDYANYTITRTMTELPDYITINKQLPNIPALGFLNESNTRGMENENPILLYSDYADRIKFNEPKAFFKKVANDSLLQNRIKAFDTEVVKPYLIEDSKKWLESFPSLQIINLNIPTVTGYEFEKSPELITEYIKKFLNKL